MLIYTIYAEDMALVCQDRRDYNVNELALKIHMDAGERVFTKAGAFVTGESFGQRNYRFEKILLGPQGNPMQAAIGQLTRRFTGENLLLMKVTASCYGCDSAK